jgi:hypothetical protein
MNNVVKLHPSRDPDAVLDDMKKQQLQSVLVIGYTDQGLLRGAASADMDEAEVIMLMRLMERAVIDSMVSE